MNTRTAAPVAITVSLVVLMSGCAGAAAQGGQVRDDLRPAQNAAQQELVRGHVIGADRIERALNAAAERALNSDAQRGMSAEARRELHASAPVSQAAPFSADVRRELHASAPVSETVPFSAEVRRELHAGPPAATTVDVRDDLSPLGDARRDSNTPTDTVDDDLSPLGSSH
ncbi:MAG TPA: hypothetical protein VF000_08450 [Agromyces sp.]